MKAELLETIHIREITKIDLFDFFKGSLLEPRATDSIILFDALHNFLDAKILELAVKKSLTEKGKADAAKLKSDFQAAEKVIGANVFVIY